MFWHKGTWPRAGQTTTYMILAVQYLLGTEEIWLRPDMVMGLLRSVEELKL